MGGNGRTHLETNAGPISVSITVLSSVDHRENLWDIYDIGPAWYGLIWPFCEIKGIVDEVCQHWETCNGLKSDAVVSSRA